MNEYGNVCTRLMNLDIAQKMSLHHTFLSPFFRCTYINSQIKDHTKILILTALAHLCFPRLHFNEYFESQYSSVKVKTAAIYSIFAVMTVVTLIHNILQAQIRASKSRGKKFSDPNDSYRYKIKF